MPMRRARGLLPITGKEVADLGVPCGRINRMHIACPPAPTGMKLEKAC